MANDIPLNSHLMSPSTWALSPFDSENGRENLVQYRVDAIRDEHLAERPANGSNGSRVSDFAQSSRVVSQIELFQNAVEETSAYSSGRNHESSRF